MLIIRLARWWRKKAAFYRVVLTEHSKPVKSWYKEVLGWFDPIKHTQEINYDAVKEWIWKGSQLSNRVAKICYKATNEEIFKKFIKETDRVRKKKNAPDEPEEEAAPAPVAEAAAVAAVVEEVKEEAPAEEATTAEAGQEAEAPAEEAKEEAPTEEAKEEAPAKETKEEAPAE